MNNEIKNYTLIPNNMVQNIISDNIIKPSYIQLYGKRTVAYFKQLIELQNIREDICFSIDMILWKIRIKDSLNIKKERKYFKDFLINIHKNSLINFNSSINLQKINSSDFLVSKLNIYDYKENKDDNKYKVNFFILLDSEYNKIMNEYSENLDKYNLLNLFCNIKSRIFINSTDTLLTEKKPEVSYPSYNTIMNDIFLESDKTLRKYIDELIRLNLIRFDYAGDMIIKNGNDKPIRRKANFTYALFKEGWENELENAITLFRSQKREVGWSFLTKEKEISANEKRSVTQKINMLEKLFKDKNLTQSQNKELKKLKKQQEKWKVEYDEGIDIRKIEEDKLKDKYPDKDLSEIYDDMEFENKAKRAYIKEEEEEDYEEYDNEIDIKSIGE